MKLDGLRVLDCSMYLPGPVISRMMADHGAEVIRIESPSGEPSRRSGPFRNGESIWFANTHRGKKSLAVDLKQAAGAAVVQQLAGTADVFIEGFRPGVAARLGIDAATLRAINPRLVYCSLSAFGQFGPLSGMGSHDMGAQAYTGLLALNDDGVGDPVVPGLPGADMACAMTGLSAILMALLRRETTGEGDYADIAMYDSLLAWTAHLSGSVLADRQAPRTATHRSIGGAALYNIYRTQDGRHLALTGRERHFASALLPLLGLGDLLDGYTEEPGSYQQTLIGRLRDSFASRPLCEWIAALDGTGVSFAPILDMVEAYDHPHILAREMVVSDERNALYTGDPIKFAAEPGQPNGTAPALGEHADALLRDIGYSADRIRDLRSDGVLVSA